jgi:NitT/TauT family transport system substrate-binding protein
MSSAQKTPCLMLRLVLVIAVMGGSKICFGADSSQTLGLRAVYNAVGGSMAPIWVAQEAGLFSKHGLDVQLKYLAATTAVQAMLGETEDIGLVGNQGIDANLEGADLVYVATATPTFVFHLYGDPHIKSVADLKGKVVAATQAAASTDYATRIVLTRFGLVPDKDVRILYAGTMPALLSAVKSGNAAAGIMSAPTTIQARAIGLKEIVDITALRIPFLFVGLLTRRKVARENGEAVLRFVRAHIEAISVIRKDKETTIRAMGKFLKTDNRQVLESVYEEYADVFPKVPLMSEAEVKAVLDVARNPRAKQMRPEEFFDNSFVHKIEASGFIESLYTR